MSLKKPLPEAEPAPSFRPTDAYFEEDYVNLGDYIKILWEARWFIAAFTIGTALLALVFSFFLPKTYEARVKLLVLAPPFKTEMNPPTLSVETYREIADFSAVKTRVADELKQKGMLQQASLGEMRTELSASKMPGQPFSPLLELVVEASTGELAQAAANLWGEIFVRENATISSEGKAGSVEFVQTQFPAAVNSLRQVEEELNQTQGGYEQKEARFNSDWDKRQADYGLETQLLLSDHKLETERLVLEFSLETNQKTFELNEETAELLKQYQLETQSLLAEVSQELRIDRLQKQLDIKLAKLNEHQGKLSDLRLALKTTQDRLKSLQAEIQSQPQFLVVSKAITDDALFNKVGKNGELPEELNRLRLQTQEINPVYQNILNDLVTTKIGYDSLLPQRDHLEVEIELVKKEIDDLRKELDDKKLQYSTLEKSRENGLKTLTESREKGLEALKLTRANQLEALKIRRTNEYARLETERKLGADNLARQRKVLADGLSREKNLAVAVLQRETENKQGTYKLLAAKAEAAQLAKVEQTMDVKLVTQAIKPESPTKPRPYFNATIALVVGGMLACFIVFGKSYLSSLQETN